MAAPPHEPHGALSLLSDGAVARLAADGDRPAFAELVRRAAPVVRGMLRRMGAPADAADDVLQDAFVVALEKLSSYRGDASFARWTMTIAARLYTRRCRRAARLIVIADPISSDARGDWAEDAAAAALDLDQALRRLSEAERLCVTLCHAAGLTHEEIARALAVPLGTVKSHVRRGLAKLRARLNPDAPSRSRRERDD